MVAVAEKHHLTTHKPQLLPATLRIGNPGHPAISRVLKKKHARSKIILQETLHGYRGLTSNISDACASFVSHMAEQQNAAFFLRLGVFR